MKDYKETREIEIDDTRPITDPELAHEFKCVVDILTDKREDIKHTIPLMKHLLESAPIYSNVIYASFLHLEIGHIYYENGYMVKAVNSYSKAAEIRPDWYKPHTWAAHTYILLVEKKQSLGNMIEKALDHTIKAMDAIDAHDGDKTGIDMDFTLIDNRGWCEMKLGQYNQAIETLTALLDIEHDDIEQWRIRSYLGTCRKGLKDWSGAVLEFDRAIDLNPKDHALHASRGNVFDDHATDLEGCNPVNDDEAREIANKAHDYRKNAICSYHRALDIAGNAGDEATAGYYCNLGVILLNDGQKVAAFEAYNRAVQIEPQSAEIRVRRGSFRLLVAKRDNTTPNQLEIEEARRDFDKAEELLDREYDPCPGESLVDLPHDIYELRDRLRKLVGLDRE